MPVFLQLKICCFSRLKSPITYGTTEMVKKNRENIHALTEKSRVSGFISYPATWPFICTVIMIGTLSSTDFIIYLKQAFSTSSGCQVENTLMNKIMPMEKSGKKCKGVRADLPLRLKEHPLLVNNDHRQPWCLLCGLKIFPAEKREPLSCTGRKNRFPRFTCHFSGCASMDNVKLYRIDPRFCVKS